MRPLAGRQVSVRELELPATMPAGNSGWWSSSVSSVRAVMSGPLKNARLLEPVAMVWIDQAMKRGRG